RLAGSGPGIGDLVDDDRALAGDGCAHGRNRKARGRQARPGARRLTGRSRQGWTAPMAIDFSLSPELEAIRDRMRSFIHTVVRPLEAGIDHDDRKSLIDAIIQMRTAAHEWGLWLPHMPEEWGGMGLGHVELAMVQAEAAKTGFGPFAINAQAPDE